MSADLPVKAQEGLEKIGARDYADLVRQGISIFPGGVLPKTRRERMALLPEDPYADNLPARQREMLDRLATLDDRFFALYGDGEQF